MEYQKIYKRMLNEQLFELLELINDSIIPADDITIPDWAEENLYLSPRVTPRPGYIILEPYQRDPLLWIKDNRHVVLCWGAQVGKSAVVQALLGYIADIDPGPTLFVYPDQATGRKRSRKHLRTMFEDSPKLRRHFTDDKNDMTNFEYHLDRMTINIAWSGSPAAMAAEAIRWLLRDETGKFAGETATEADSISLSERRTIAFGEMARIFDTSTPTIPDDEPWYSYTLGTQNYRFIPCPHCGEYDHLEFEKNFRYPDQGKDEMWKDYLIRAENEAYYVCDKCGEKFSDRDILLGDKVGEYREQNPGAKIISCRVPSWYSRKVKCGEVVKRYLLAKDNPSKMKDFLNSDCALPNENISSQADRKTIRAHIQEYDSGVPTDEPCIIVMCCDIHKNFQRYNVRAHSATKSWLIDYGEVRTIEQLKDLKQSLQYKNKRGNLLYGIDMVLSDCQYNPDPIYQWSDEDSTVFPIMARGKTGVVRFHKAPLKANVEVCNIHEDFFKERLLDCFNSGIEKNEYNELKANWFLPETVSEKYISELLSETVRELTDKKGNTIREWIKLSKKNHNYDLEKYQCAARYLLSSSGRFEAINTPQERIETYQSKAPKGWQ